MDTYEDVVNRAHLAALDGHQPTILCNNEVEQLLTLDELIDRSPLTGIQHINITTFTITLTPHT